MSSPFIQVPYSPPVGSGVFIDLIDTAPMFPSKFETGAIEHWLYGDDNPTMVGGLQGLPMQRNVTFATTNVGAGYSSTPTLSGLPAGMIAEPIRNGATITGVEVLANGAPVTTPPTISINGGGYSTQATVSGVLSAAPTQSPGYLSIAGTGVIGGPQNAVASPLAIQANRSFCVAFKRRAAAANPMIMGYWPSMGVTNRAGNLLWMASNGSGLYQVSTFDNTGTAQGPLAAAAPGAVGDWVFAMLGYDAGNVHLRWGGGSSYTAAVALNERGQTFRLGSNNGGAFAWALDFAELIAFDHLLSQNEFNALYARSKTRLADRGVALF